MAYLNTNIGPERVQVFDVPLGTVQLPGVATSVTAFLIYTTKSGAPVNAPTAITSFDQFTNAFGDADEVAHDGYYAVQGFFDNGGTGNTAIIVNVASDAAASYVGSASAGTGFRALDLVDIVGLVCVPGLPLSMAYLVDPANIDYTKVVRAEFGSTLSTSFSLVSIPKEISLANSDALVVTAPSTGVSGSGPYVIGLNLGGAAVAAHGSLVVNNYLDLTGDYLTLNTTTLTEGVEWAAATSNNVTATNIATAINTAAIGFTATPSAATVNIVANTPGSAGNVALVSSDPGDLIPSGSTLTGGADASPVISLAGVTAGMLATNSAGTHKYVISAVGASDITVITDPSAYLGSGQSVLMKTPSAINYKDFVVNNPSREVSWYFNNALVLDQSALVSPGTLKAVSPVGHVAGVMARMDANLQIGGVSHAPAGIRFAGIAGIAGLTLALSERIDAAPLRLAWINRITSFPGSGNIIFGGYTAGGSTVTADEQLIQVIRSLQYIKGSLERGLRGFLWENFSPATQDQIAKAIEAFMRNNIYLFPQGLPEASQFRVISITPTQNELDQGLLRVRVQVRPNSAVRFIEIDLEFPIPTA